MRWDDLAVLEALDDVWQTFDEVWPSVRELRRRQVRNRLLSLRLRGLVDSRRSDAHGRVEYALTDEGFAVLSDDNRKVST